MKLEEYVEKARSTAIYPNRGKNLAYTVLGLIEEAYELKEKLLEGDSAGAILEASDLMWYLNACCDELGLPIQSIFFSVDVDVDFESLAVSAETILDQAAIAGGIVKKIIRDEGGSPSISKAIKVQNCLAMVSAHLQQIADDMQVTMSEIYETNIQKLFSRKARGVIGGSGDNR